MAHPTVFHVTHWKAGSQWIHRILVDLVSKDIVKAQIDQSQFLQNSIRPGAVYPTVYVTKEQFETVDLPEDRYHFLVIRDLRDTMISAYYSMKMSHPGVGRVPEWRKTLGNMNEEDGLMWILDQWLPSCAHIQSSWIAAQEPFIRYEDLLDNDVAILDRVLRQEAQFNVSREELEKAVVANRFANLTGRQRGREDQRAHERKGIAGDWRNHFTDKIHDAFKERYGRVLIETGCEQNLDW